MRVPSVGRSLEYIAMSEKRGFNLGFPQIVLIAALILLGLWIASGNSPLTSHETVPAAQQSDSGG